MSIFQLFVDILAVIGGLCVASTTIVTLFMLRVSAAALSGRKQFAEIDPTSPSRPNEIVRPFLTHGISAFAARH